MATIINNPPAQSPAPSDGGGSATGMIVGILLVIVVGFLFFMYGLPAMRGTANMPQDRDMKSDDMGSPTINVPDKIDVNIKK